MKKLIFIILIFLNISCASRKVNIDRSNIKKDSIGKVDIKVVENDGTNIDIKNDILIDEIIVKPIDSTKDIVVDGKHYKNVILNIKKTKDNSVYTEKKIVNKIVTEKKAESVVTSKVSIKKESNKGTNYFPFIFMVLTGGVAYIIWKYNLYKI